MKDAAQHRPLEFGRWLRQGRGLALLRAREAAGPGQRDILLDACTHFTGYDFQVEGSRAEYLFDVLVAAGERESLEAPLLEALGQRDSWDREQLLDLAYLFALDGSAAAEHALRDTFVRCAAEPSRPGAPQVVRGCGLPGLVLVARELGRVMPEQGADWDEAHPLEVAEEHFGVEAVADTLAQAALGEPYVRRYLDAVQAYRVKLAQRERGTRAPLPFALTFEALRASVLDPGKRPKRWLSRRWGLEAPVAEVERAVEALRAGVPAELRLAILWAFGARPFPGPSGVLIDALNSEEAEIRNAAWELLSHVESDEVRARAREELRQPQASVRALQGLERNFRDEDVPLVANVLSGITDPDDLHFAGLALLDTVDACGGPHLAPLLLTLYEAGTCGHCRHSLAGRMHELGVAPPAVVQECRYDAFLDLRADAVAWASSPTH
jgi:hypothetical protein